MKKTVIISALSLIAIVLYFSGTFVKVGYVETHERNVDSFSEVSLWMGVAGGLIMIFVAFWTFKVHIVAGIIPFGVGFVMLSACVYFLWCKSLV